MVKDFTDLEIYRLAEKLSEEIYFLSLKFPKDEVFGLTSQIKRATLSVGANIAEGFGRYHYKDKINFFYHARGSLLEVEHFLRFAKIKKWIGEKDYERLTKEAKNLGVKLNNFIKAIYRHAQSV